MYRGDHLRWLPSVGGMWSASVWVRRGLGNDAVCAVPLYLWDWLQSLGYLSVLRCSGF